MRPRPPIWRVVGSTDKFVSVQLRKIPQLKNRQLSLAGQLSPQPAVCEKRRGTGPK